MSLQAKSSLKMISQCKYQECGCCAYCPTYTREECKTECKEVPDTCDGVKEYIFVDEEAWARQNAGGK